MLPLIVLGVITGSVVGMVTGRTLAVAVPRGVVAGRTPKEEEGIPPFRLVQEQVIQEESVILATEEVPLDNRFGNRVLVSEHEFSRTATTGLKLGRSRDLELSTDLDLKVLEAMVKSKLAGTVGIDLGSQINRRIRLKFEADPGKFVHYRVVWKQESRRGLLEVAVAGSSHQLPYLATYGLYHSVESLDTAHS